MAVFTTLTEAKAHLHVDYDDDDVYIAGLQNLVEELVLTEVQGEERTPIEGWVTTNTTTTIVGYLTNFLDYTVGDIIVVAGESPRIIVTIISDVVMTVSVATTSSAIGVTYRVYTGLPTLNGALPLGLKQAMLLLIGHYYNNREAVMIGVGATEIPLGYKNLIQSYKNWTVA